MYIFGIGLAGIREVGVDQAIQPNQVLFAGKISHDSLPKEFASC